MRPRPLAYVTVGFLGGAALLALTACAPAARSRDATTAQATPTPDAMMMAKETATPDAMMGEKDSATPDAMMKKDSATPDAMMQATATPGATMTKGAGDSMMMEKKVPLQTFAPHFVDSSPMHGQTLKQAPETIVINFNFNLHDKSAVTVARDGAAVGTVRTSIDSNRLALRTSLGGATADGVYVVSYSACWPDGSCHEGQFGFVVDSKAGTAYVDMTGKPEVTIPMQGTAFSPAKIVVSKGTVVSWTNKDAVTHFVNTDPHPSHNLLPDQNSLAIEPGKSYSFTFTEPGEWGSTIAAPTSPRA